MNFKNTILLARTLTHQQLQAERNKLLPGLMERAENISELEDSLRLQFATRPELISELADVTE